MKKRLLNRENAYALLICVVAILLIIFTADVAPPFIYQGF
jgi:hypothetical protein